MLLRRNRRGRTAVKRRRGQREGCVGANRSPRHRDKPSRMRQRSSLRLTLVRMRHGLAS
jgi:hypothetical protein